jgi:hypothetical protein
MDDRNIDLGDDRGGGESSHIWIMSVCSQMWGV